MQEILATLYFWLKAGHLIFVIFWMAGLFMLPRFFVYHQEDGETGSEMDKIWIEREAKLRKIILLPAIVVVWLLGLTLLGTGMVPIGGWFHLKMVLVLALSGYHGWLVSYSKKLARGERPLTDKTLRLVNEVPGLAVAIIVVLAIVKPF